MLSERSRHRLDGVVGVVEPGVHDRFTQPGEALDVERDVVVDEEDGLGAMAARVADIREHPFDWIRVKVAAAHLDDRAEAAVERAAARRFDDVDPASEQRISSEHPGVAIGQPQRL